MKYMSSLRNAPWHNCNSMLLLLLAVIFATCLALPGCARKKALILTKGSVDERGGVKGECRLGEYCGSISDELCSRDLDKIMERAGLDTFQKDELRSLVCSGEHDTAEVEEYCSSLDEETRARLYRAFEQYGYYINGYG